MRKFWRICFYILILQFMSVVAALSNTLTLGERGEVIAETDRYYVRFENGAVVHFHNKLTQETYTIPGQAPNTESGISIQYEEGEYGRREEINEHWESTSKRLTPLALEIVYHSDYRVPKTIQMRISIDESTGDLIIQQHGISEHVVGVMWECGNINGSQVEVILPANGGQIIDASTDFSEKYFEYPGDWEAQLVILHGEIGGFFVRSTDTTYRYKVFRYMRHAEHFDITFETVNQAPFQDKNEITSVEWRLNAYRGDWQVPALYYRDWMEPVLQPKQPPVWVKDIELVIYFSDMNMNTLSLLASHVNPSTTLLYLTSWRTGGWDENFPEYMPKPEFGNLLEEANTHGFRVMLHASFLGCSTYHPLYPEFEKFQFRHPIRGHKLGWEGRTNRESFAYINPASGAFRKYLVRQLKTVSDTYSIDAFHLDVNTFIKNDANGLIEGLTAADGNVLLHQELAEAMPGIVFGGEHLHEVTFPYVILTQRWNIPEDEQPHPISSFLFSSYTIPYGYHVPNPDIEPELYRPFQETYTVWGVLPTLRIRGPWHLNDPSMIRTRGYLKSVQNGQSWERTWNIDMGMNRVGDLNGDGIVNILDLVIIANAFGEAEYEYDLNGDGIVNILDLVIIAKFIGK